MLNSLDCKHPCPKSYYLGGKELLLLQFFPLSALFPQFFNLAIYSEIKR